VTNAWDERYRSADKLDYTPSPLVVQVAETVSPGRALDLACGPGRHALHLACAGWEVTAVDSSSVAIEMLRARAASGGIAVDARLADLEAGEFTIEPANWDLVCDFFYLQRDLFPAIRAGIRPGGLFAGAIHLLDETAGAPPPHNPAFVLRSGELREEFAGWKILYYSETHEAGHRRRAARILARKA
jgi:tellurite methyltransferase